MLAMGRSVSVSRPHSTWPVAASASTAPLALTPPGAPVTAIVGRGEGRGDGERADEGARVRAPIAASGPAAARGLCPVSVQAATPPTTTVITVRMMSHVLSRTTPRPRSEAIDEAYLRRDLDPRGRCGPGGSVARG